MNYIGLLLMAGGFFACGYYAHAWIALQRLRKFVGKDINFLEVCEIISTFGKRGGSDE
jgi:hypothetical protein